MPPRAEPLTDRPRAQTGRHQYSLRTSLILLVVLCVTPVALIGTALLYNNYELRRSQMEQGTILMARKVVSDLESALAAIEAALKVLATAKGLAVGDLQGFHQQARDALASGIVANYILTAPDGHQVLNTWAPYGSVLPTTGTPEQLAAVFSERRTVLTDLFTGPLTRQPVLAMGVPVQQGDQVVYSLNIGLPPTRINEILARQEIRAGWLIAVLDTGGTIIARSREAERYVGQKAVSPLAEAIRQQAEGKLVTLTKEGIPVFTAFARSERWGWSVAVGAPVAHVEEDVAPLVWRVVGAIGLALLIGLGLALLLARRVVATVRLLNHAAARACQGETVSLPEIEFTEAGAVSNAIAEAARAMGEVRYLAHHDALTGLANRWLFFEEARRQIALAARNASPLALIAVDLDGFKTVNDCEGHANGDLVLKTAAQRIQECIRASDLGARLGGDEFIVLLTDSEERAALQSAERLIQHLAAPYSGSTCPVSGSAGVAIYPRDGTTLDELLRQADRALYAAKAAGKNTVRLAPA